MCPTGRSSPPIPPRVRLEQRPGRGSGDPASVADLRRVSSVAGDDVHAIHSAELLVVPSASPWYGHRLRTVQSRFTDPVSFALLAGSPSAAFPAVRGWSATDWARRAVAERSAWLAAPGPPRPMRGWRGPPDPAAETATAGSYLLGSARAALFALSLSAGEPHLLLSAEAVAATTGGATTTLHERLQGDIEPSAGELGAVRETVRELLDRARQCLPGR